MKKRDLVFSVLVCSTLLATIFIVGCGKESSFENWQKKITKLTGSDSVESETLTECAESMEAKIKECSGKEGWMVDNQVSITEFKTNQHYDLQDVRQGGCEGLKNKDPRPFTVDSKFLDTQSEKEAASFQIVCSISCYSWSCEIPTNEPELNESSGTSSIEPPVPEPVPEIKTTQYPKEKFSADFHTDASGPIIVEGAEAKVDFKVDGGFWFEILEDGSIEGEGNGNFKINMVGDIGIGTCTGEKVIPVTFSVNGQYNPNTNEVRYKIANLNPGKDIMQAICITEYSGVLNYEIDIPLEAAVSMMVNDYTYIKLEEGTKIEKTYSHLVLDWGTTLQANWIISIVSATEFDFDVNVEPPIINISQGSTAAAHITVKLVKGLPKNVQLTATKWPGLISNIANEIVTPTETTTLTLLTDCSTKPSDYLYTVRGETEGTFRTSSDSVHIYINKNPSCK